MKSKCRYCGGSPVLKHETGRATIGEEEREFWCVTCTHCKANTGYDHRTKEEAIGLWEKGKIEK